MVDGASAEDGVTGTIAQLMDSGVWDGVQGAMAMCRGLGGGRAWSPSSWAGMETKGQHMHYRIDDRDSTQTMLQMREQLSKQVLGHDPDIGLDVVVED